MNEGSAKQQIVEAIKSNSNILVTVSDSPSVDELSAALGLTILLNKLDKRATSIFSGAIPPAITFLDPEKTLEGTVDSLRDFIIALDKEKADHLRYKVDGDVVKIFITPYRTTLTDKDLQFSQGDYNVELVIALGVKDQDHLDKALSAHGRILHDATVTTISVGADPSTLGSIDWRDAAASSLCEMLISLSEALKEDQPILDEQIATAFLTGIVSATDRFSNDRTSSRVMTMAAQLMAAGANQQLIAAKLREAHDIGPNSVPKASKNNADGTVTITEDKPAKVDKDHKKSDKKSKKDENGLKIDRDDKSDKKPEDKPAGSDAAEAAAAREALKAAEPAKDVEEELAKQLDQVVAEPAPPAIADIEKELGEAAKAEAPVAPIADAPAPIVPDMEMPGFESLDVPMQPAPEIPAPEPMSPVSEVSDFIDARPGSSYLSDSKPASFDAPVDGIISSTGATPDDQPIDPFSMPLAPLPDLHESKEVTPDIVDPSALSPAPEAPANVAADTALPPFEELAPPVPAMPPANDMPPLPPLPDFPLPPPPPVFDQPAAAPPLPTQAGAISAENLGDIFGDASAPAAPAAETPPPTPPTPGQFRIPGQ